MGVEVVGLWALGIGAVSDAFVYLSELMRFQSRFGLEIPYTNLLTGVFHYFVYLEFKT